jgi:hypothetical protein
MSLYRGIVSGNSDPDGRGRLRVEIPAVGVDLWAEMVVPIGAEFLAVPDLGTGVWVAFEGDDFAAPVVLGTMLGG